MRNDRLDAILAKSRPLFSDHWARCLEAGLDGHSVEAHAAINETFAKYIRQLRALPEPADQAAIIEALKQLFVNLDALLDTYGGGLLETDERELLLPQVLQAAKIAGLNLNAFENADPTLTYRNF